MNNNKYKAAVDYLSDYVELTAEKVCSGNEVLKDVPEALNYCLDILKANESYMP